MWKRPLVTYRPASSAGNLYYVRLKTESGILYKLGFTSLESVHARLSYGGSGHEKLIDKVLFFEYFEDAFDIEDKFHSLFKNKAVFSKRYPKPYAPLFNNGQSELYAEDILMLDPEYSLEQAADVVRKLEISDYINKGMTEEAAISKLNLEKNLVKCLTFVFYPVFWLFIGIGWMWDRFIADKDQLDKERKDRSDFSKKHELEKSTLMNRIKNSQALNELEVEKWIEQDSVIAQAKARALAGIRK